MPAKFGILLLHGLTGVPSEMRPVEKMLRKLGYEVEAATLAGHGGTHEELLAVGWKQWIDSAQQSLDDLAKRADRIVACGLSMGSSICSILASRNENVAGLVMLSPTLQYDSPEFDKKLHLRMYKQKWVQSFVHSLVTAFPIIGRKVWWTETPPYGLKDERLQRQITKAIEAAQRGEDTKFGLFRTYYGSLHQMCYVSDEFRRTAQAVRCPALVMNSLEDTLVGINNATETYALLGTQNKSLAMLTGCDHVLTLDLKRNYVCSLIAEFMEAVTDTHHEGVAESDMELSIEVHNRLNPLTPADWDRLVPGSPDLSAFAQSLQQQGVHESNCHAVIVRHHNRPIILIPLIALPNGTALLGMNQSLWGKTVGTGDVDETIHKSAWVQLDRVITELRTSFHLKNLSFYQNQSDDPGDNKHRSGTVFDGALR
jgi:carboxylesterase